MPGFIASNAMMAIGVNPQNIAKIILPENFSHIISARQAIPES